MTRAGGSPVVHNGVIENYEQIREKLKGHTFYSATDTEVLAHFDWRALRKVKQGTGTPSGSAMRMRIRWRRR
jgi:glucosamine 6-phosphate synthetase-like amidotransferase/phosphosugar isomerase protein